MKASLVSKKLWKKAFDSMKADSQKLRSQLLFGQTLMVRSYRMGERYVCDVNHPDQAVRVARAEARSREEAEWLAVEKARERLKRRLQQ